MSNLVFALASSRRDCLWAGAGRCCECVLVSTGEESSRSSGDDPNQAALGFPRFPSKHDHPQSSRPPSPTRARLVLKRRRKQASALLICSRQQIGLVQLSHARSALSPLLCDGTVSRESLAACRGSRPFVAERFHTTCRNRTERRGARQAGSSVQGVVVSLSRLPLSRPLIERRGTGLSFKVKRHCRACCRSTELRCGCGQQIVADVVEGRSPARGFELTSTASSAARLARPTSWTQVRRQAHAYVLIASPPSPPTTRPRTSGRPLRDRSRSRRRDTHTERTDKTWSASS